jgi:hypothetical protein
VPVINPRHDQQDHQMNDGFIPKLDDDAFNEMEKGRNNNNN